MTERHIQKGDPQQVLVRYSDGDIEANPRPGIIATAGVRKTSTRAAA